MKKLFGIILFFIFISFNCFANERILNYDVVLDVQKDSSIIVTEKITINVEGDKVKRGIVRSLPTSDDVKYHLISVNRNGRYEPSFIERLGGFFEINTGDDDYLQIYKNHTFEIKYRVYNAIKSYKDIDELYWNVTGNDWIFPIDNIRVEVKLPDGLKILQESSYIGTMGSREKGLYENSIFSSPRSLEAGEGITIAVGFEKGYLTFKSYDRLLISLAVLFLIIIITYCAISWFITGRGLKRAVAYPRFDKPKDLTAAQAGEIYFMGKKKNRLSVISLFDMAIDKFIFIKEVGKNYLLKKSGLKEAENREEQIFENTYGEEIEFSDGYNNKIEIFNSRISDYLKEIDAKYFKTNTKFFLFGIGIFILSFLCLFFVNNDFSFSLENPDNVSMIVLCVLTSVFLFEVFSEKSNIIFKIFLGIFVGNYFVVLITDIGGTNSLILIVFSIISLIILFIFRIFIKRYTEDGLNVMAHLRGLKMFMAETDIANRDSYSLSDMEALIPYAIIFNIEDKWSKKLEALLAASTVEVKTGSFSYRNGRISSRRFRRYFNTASVVSGHGGYSFASRGGGFSGGGRGGGGGRGR